MRTEKVFDLGGKVGFVTNREKTDDNHTWNNLVAQGIPVTPENSCLMGRSQADVDSEHLPEFINDNMPASTSLSEILEGADVFIGLSRGNVLSKEMVKKMAENSIIFAMANPEPEIDPTTARIVRPDAIVAT